MTRTHLTFACDGMTLFGTLDAGAQDTGLLIVSGGNEIRSGAWSGQAQLAARLAAGGHPVFRFDRRGVGDSEGANGSFRTNREDIAAALAAFRAATPPLRRVIAFGNCDAASALTLFAAGLALDGLVLANPWTVDSEADGEPVQSPAGLRRRYLAKLSDPSEWRRLLGGKIALGSAMRDIGRAAIPAPVSALARDMQAGLAAFGGAATILLAERDRAAELFLDAWDPGDPRLRRYASAAHSFAEADAREWLFEQVLAALRT